MRAGTGGEESVSGPSSRSDQSEMTSSGQGRELGLTRGQVAASCDVTLRSDLDTQNPVLSVQPDFMHGSVET